jgi:histidinol-phosphatase
VENDLSVAVRATLAGAAVGLRHFAALERLRREHKPDGSIVTEADRAVETAVRGVLGEARPGDAVLGEEHGSSGDGRRRWIVDPIDGTAMFVAGDDRWLVLLALEVDGAVEVGVAAVPAQGGIWWAVRGGGAHTSDLDGGNARRIAVAAGPDVLDGSRLGVIPDGTELERYAPLRAAAREVPWRSHPALLVAAGELDLALQPTGQVWDFAATSLIVREAGGSHGEGRPVTGPALFARSAALRRAARAMY